MKGKEKKEKEGREGGRNMKGYLGIFHFIFRYIKQMQN